MKNKFTNLKKMSLLFWMAVLILAVAVSCKKKEDDPIPLPPAPTPTPISPVVFNNQAPAMHTEWERTNNHNFLGLSFRSLGRGLKGEEDPEIPDFKEIGKTLWEVHDYLHTEHEFKEIDDDLNTLMGDAQAMMNMIAQLGVEMQMQTTALENFFNEGTIANQVTVVNAEYNHQTPNRYGYFMYVGSQYEQDSSAWSSAMQAASQAVPTYATEVYLSAPGSEPAITNVGQNIHDALVVASAGQQKPIHLYTQALVNAAAGKIGGDAGNAMKVYQMLENYFLWALTAQYQAQVVVLNCAGYCDPDSSKHYYATSFNQFQIWIVDEVAAYLEEVNYLVVNLDDHRTSQRWSNDAQFGDAGLAPDLVWLNVLARGQFVANSIYDGINLAYPVMCGRIITPLNYTDGASPIVDVLTLNSSVKNLTDTADKVPSMIPYAAWIKGNPAQVFWDNNWNVYTFGKMGVPDPHWDNVHTNALSLNCTDQYHPWTHSAKNIDGNVTCYFYNPRDLNDKSSTWDPTHTMLFGFFSLNWKWGYMYLRYSTDTWQCGVTWCPAQLYEYSVQSPFYYLLECSGRSWFSATSPYVCGCNSGWHTCTQDAYKNNFSWGGDIGLSQMTYNGSAFNYSGGQVDYIHAMFLDFKANDMIGGNTAWYALYGQSWFNSSNSNNVSTLSVYVGTGTVHPRGTSSGANISNANLLNFSNSSPGQWATSTGWGGNFSAGSQSPNFGFEFFVNRSNGNENLNLIYKNMGAAIVFGGYASSTAP
jgi:hypothetical protein